MRYSLNPFRWLLYLINRVRYRHSRWLHYHASVPYSKRYIRKQLRKLIQDTLKELPQNFLGDAFTKIDYTLCKNDKGEYYSGGYEFNR